MRQAPVCFRLACRQKRLRHRLPPEKAGTDRRAYAALEGAVSIPRGWQRFDCQNSFKIDNLALPI